MKKKYFFIHSRSINSKKNYEQNTVDSLAKSNLSLKDLDSLLCLRKWYFLSIGKISSNVDPFS